MQNRRAAIKAKGWTHGEAAERLGVSLATIDRWVAGKDSGHRCPVTIEVDGESYPASVPIEAALVLYGRVVQGMITGQPEKVSRRQTNIVDENMSA